MVIAAGDGEGVVGRPAGRRWSASGEHQHLAGPSGTSPPPPPLAEEKEAFHSRRLHNFCFPPSSLRWGNQRLLRCSNLPNVTDPGSRQPFPPAGAAGHNHHREVAAAAGKRPVSSSSPSREKSRADDSSSSAAAAAAAAAAVEAEAARPWNLRTRRAACNAPAEDGRGRRQALVSGSVSCLATEKNGSPAAGKQSKGLEKKTKRREFLITLTKKEIEEDYRVFKGTKPPRRPKRRPRNVQREIDFLFPGCGLSEITPDAYKIDE